MQNISSGDEENNERKIDEEMAVCVTSPGKFEIEGEARATAGIQWESYAESMDLFIEAIGVTDGKRKKAILLLEMGPGLREIYETVKKDNDDYEAVKKAIKETLSPSSNPEFETFLFGEMKQKEAESFDEFYVRLYQDAKRCDFRDRIDKELKRQIIAGCRSAKLKEKILSEPGKALKDVLSWARAVEAVKMQSKAMEANVKNEPIEAIRRTCTFERKEGLNSRSKKGFNDTRRSSKSEESCPNCGFEKHARENCPANGKTCKLCKRLGHFGKVCRSARYSQKQIGTLSSGNAASPDNEGFVYGTSAGNERRPKIKVKVLNLSIEFVIDSGAAANTITESSFQRLNPPPKLLPSQLELTTYGNQQLRVKGEFETEVKTGGKTATIKFQVIEAGFSVEDNLLGYKSAKNLGLFDLPIFRADIEAIGIKHDYSGFFKQFPEVFNDGIGKLRNYEVELKVDTSVRPVQQAYWRQPFHLKRAIEEEIGKLIENDVIEEAKGPVSWLSEMVVVPKPKKPGQVRITTDARSANKAIIRDNIAMPTTEEITHELNGATVFSEQDLNKTFHQLELAPESRAITTFRTAQGNMRFKRLHMGVCSASEIFHSAIQNEVLRGMEGVRNLADNIIVWGKSRSEHDERLKKVCERLKYCCLTVSRENCQLGVEELIFYGMKISKEGVSLSEDKVKAIKEAGTPRDVSELRSLLGLSVYCGSHIPNLATFSDPLWELVRSKEPFKWLEKHDAALQSLKDAIIRFALAPFKNDWNTAVIVDASPVGIGVVVGQVE